MSNHFMVITAVVVMLAGCVHKCEIAPAPLAATGHTRFEVFGMLGEYVARDTDGIRIEEFDGYYPTETGAAAHFEKLLRAFCAEEGINPTFDKKVGSEGDIIFFSPAIAAVIDRHYTNGTLDESVFDGASDEDLLRYVAGAYLRFGDDKKRAVIVELNAGRKLHTVGIVLSRLGCSGVKLYYTTNLVPASCVLVFSPSQRVKKRLGILKELAVSELTDHPDDLELWVEIPPNQATNPTSTSVMPPARPEARQP